MWLPYLKQMMTGAPASTDTTYGPRYQDNHFQIGDSPLIIDGKFLTVKNKRYRATPGLLELMFARRPDHALPETADYFKYKDILTATNAFRKGYKWNGQMYNNNSNKYRDVIKPFFTQSYQALEASIAGLKRKPKTASGLRFVPLPSDGATSYKFWRDPNYLVSRLRLLRGSEAAGNSSHRNEIYEIERELASSNLIKYPSVY
jgi:hypothetical protein